MFKTKKIICIVCCIFVLSSLFVFPTSAANPGDREYTFGASSFIGGSTKLYAWASGSSNPVYCPVEVMSASGGLKSAANFEVSFSSNELSLIFLQFPVGNISVLKDYTFNTNFIMRYFPWWSSMPYPTHTMFEIYFSDGVRYNVYGDPPKLGQNYTTFDFSWTNNTGKNVTITKFQLSFVYESGFKSNGSDLTLSMYSDLNIKTFLDEHERDKQETTDSGNKSVNDVTNAIPSDNEGFISAFQELVDVVTYEGTDAKWTFPALYIPEISGVTPRIDLTSEIEIDFGYWIQQIPNPILIIIRCLCTAALVAFCFKELYSIIEYIMTLRKGGDD